MVYQLAAAEGTQRTFVIQPNQSMSWRALLLAFALIATVAITVGVHFLYMGLPLVLPFSGIEVLALGAALYATAWRGGVREVITISDESVAVESGRTKPETREEFQRRWAKVVLERSWNRWYPSRLIIRSHGRQVEVGKFLTEQERQGLALQLGAAMKENGSSRGIQNAG